MIELGPLYGCEISGASDINDSSTIVGGCWKNGPAEGFAYILRNGIMRELNTMISHEDGFYIGSADGINNAGQITGRGYFLGELNGVAYRLTPVPPRMGDINCDDTINVDDLIEQIGFWGPYPHGGGLGTPDLNADGLVNVFDLLLLLNNWDF